MDMAIQFVTKFFELYNIAPTFVSWLLGIVGAVFISTVGFAYWLGKTLADSKNDGLKAQIDALSSQVALAKDRAEVAQKAADSLKQESDELKKKIPAGTSSPDIDAALQNLDDRVRTVVSANTAVSGSFAIIPRTMNVSPRRFSITIPSDTVRKD